MAQSHCPQPQEVFEAAYRVHGFDLDELANRKTHTAAYYRRMLAWLMSELTTASHGEIAEAIGYKARTAVRSAVDDFPTKSGLSLFELDCLRERIEVEIQEMRKCESS